MAKKIPESKEAAAERRQRDLAALTSGVAAFSLMGGEAPRPPVPATPPVEAPVTPAAAAAASVAAAPEVAPPQPTTTGPAAKKAAPQPAATAAPLVPAVAAPADGAGRETTAPTAVAASPAAAQNEPEADADDLEEVELVEPEPQSPAEPAELDLAKLFVPSPEKKGTTLRITADHQQFFAQVGFILGAGASAPDIVHNILTKFRADHEAQIQKAMRKQMRQMMAPKK